MRLYKALAKVGLAMVLGLGFIQCGGGGGGDKARGTLALATHAVTFTGTFDDAQAPSPQFVEGSITGATSTVYLKVLYTNQGLANATVAVTGATSGQLTLYPKVPGLVGAGTFTDTVTVTASLDPAGNQPLAGSPQVVTVTSVIAPKLSAGGKSLTFNQVAGAPAVGDQSVALAGTAAPWQAAADRTWIRIRNASGTGAGNLTLGIDPAGLLAGTHQGTVTVTTTDAAHQAVTVPVTLQVLAPAFLADRNGVALCSMPGLARTTQTLQIRDSFGGVAAWTAQSSEAWLTVTPSGTAPGSLTLSADPRNLPLDTLQTATVTVGNADPNRVPEVIQVGFWVGSAAPVSVKQTLSGFAQALAMDPVRPYAYVHTGGQDLTAYNIYTGAAVKTLTLTGATLGDLVLDTDGTRLYVVDTAARKVIPVALPAFAAAAGWSLPADLWTGSLAFGRISGLRILAASSGPVLDAATGTSLGNFLSSPGYGGRIALSRDGGSLVLLDVGISPSTMAFYTVTYDPAKGGAPAFARKYSLGVGSNGRDVAISADGTRVYTACGNPYAFGVWDMTTGSGLPELPGSHYPNNITLAPDGRIVAGADVWYDPIDVWVYTPSGTLLSSQKISGYAHNLLPNTLRVSGDGARLGALTSDSSLYFVSLP